MTTASPSRALWIDAGYPGLSGHSSIDARCFICGGSCVDGGALKHDCLSGTFTDWDYTRFRSDYLCTPCAWLMNGKPPDTFRMWSLMYRSDGNFGTIRTLANGATKVIGRRTWAGNKADLTPILDALLEPPAAGIEWACALADSGKVHTFPFTLLNRQPDRWEMRFERVSVTSSPPELLPITRACARLLEAGASKESILSGAPHRVTLRTRGVDFWRREYQPLLRWRNSHLLEMALFCMRKENCERYTRNH